jgi:quercetin dioxygenase-like cupin family protein
MSLVNKLFDVGNLTGSIYDFENVGDILPNHVHDEDTAHITIVAKGAIKVTGDGWEQIWECGRVAEIKSFQSHQFEALEPNSRVVNIIKK